MQLTMLGTSAMVPTKERNHSAIFLSFRDEGILFDCGEGTQRQFKIAGIPITKASKLLLTHLHGDHILGVPGLIQSLGMSEYSQTLQIYGPPGTLDFIANMQKAFIFDNKIKMQVFEVTNGVFFKNKWIELSSVLVEHGIHAVAYRFKERDLRKIKMALIEKLGIPEGPLLGKLQNGKSINWKGKTINADDATDIKKGKIISYISDTNECSQCHEICRDADLLICEATYTHSLKHKAKEYSHLTARQAGLIANHAGVKRLVLTHFSQRYKNTQEIEEDAQAVFDNCICAEDFMKITI